MTSLESLEKFSTPNMLLCGENIAGENSGGVAAPKGSSRRLGLVGTAATIVRQEGLLGLWSGVSPGVFRHWVYTGIRISFYDKLRHLISPDSQGSNSQLQLHHRYAALLNQRHNYESPDTYMNTLVYVKKPCSALFNLRPWCFQSNLRHDVWRCCPVLRFPD